MALARVQDVNLVRSILTGGSVRISSAGGVLGIEELGPLTRERASVFADAVSELVRRNAGDGVSGGAAQSGSVVGQLERLSQLFPETARVHVPVPVGNERVRRLREWAGSGTLVNTHPPILPHRGHLRAVGCRRAALHLRDEARLVRRGPTS